MLTLSLACTLSDRTRPILDGRVTVPGVTFDATTGEPEDIFRRALRDRDLEVTELSMGSHIVTTVRGDAPSANSRKILRTTAACASSMDRWPTVVTR